RVPANSDGTPTTDPALLKEPAWVQALPRDMHERVYIGGRLEGYVNTSDDDAPKDARHLEEYSQMEQRYVVVSEFLFQPSASRIRESMSYDLPVLWPVEFARTLSLFHISSRDARMRVLKRGGPR